MENATKLWWEFSRQAATSNSQLQPEMSLPRKVYKINQAGVAHAIASESRVTPASLFRRQVKPSGQYSCTVYPTGEFTLGFAPPPKVKSKDKEYECTKGDIYFREDGFYHDRRWYELHGLTMEPTDIPPNLVNSAELSHVASKPKRKYGQKGITAYGRRCVSSAALLLQKRWGRDNTGFATLTLPRLSLAQEQVICSRWSQLVRKFFQWFKRLMEKVGADPDYCASTEIQEKRWEHRHEVGLHIHFVYQCRQRRHGKWNLNADIVRERWRELLANELHVCADMVPVPRCELSVIRKSASAYIGKYMSKGVKIVSQVSKSGKDDYLPKQWWSLGSGIRCLLKTAIIRDNNLLAEELYKSLTGYASELQVVYTRACTYSGADGRERICGYFGKTRYEEVKNYYEGLTHKKHVT